MEKSREYRSFHKKRVSLGRLEKQHIFCTIKATLLKERRAKLGV
jgi:hypothetical protein